MSGPLLEVRGLWREFPAGEGTVAVLRDVNLSIEAGEMVAIIGASGSGKSTLMNIMGCLDQPTRGAYRVAGRDTSQLDPDELAELRREHFGFIFQRYHLLTDLSALANVEVPAIYAGVARAERHKRAAALLGRLGLADRMGHHPGQLSGGQQQRVSIARALMNGGEIIFADEPTGALDSRSGQEVMKILRELHAEGRTIILVTHDAHVAAHADRIIEIADGEIVSDRRNTSASAAKPADAGAHIERSLRAVTDQFGEAARMALLAMKAHRLRTFLTMLGIIIGIASVVSVVALGEGSRRKVLAEISYMGTNTIEIWAGWGFGDTRGNRRVPLQPQDAEALANEQYIAAASPKMQTSVVARFGNIAANASVAGVSEQYFEVTGIRMAEGVAFGADAVKRRAQDVVIDQKGRKTLFPNGQQALGQVILLGNLPVRVVGVAAPSAALDSGDKENLTVFAPYTTLASRVMGRSRVRSVILRVKDGVSAGAAEQAVTRLLTMRRGGNKDFYIENADIIRKTIEGTARTMSLLISSIAVISLIVGGIGVMNIMLVSVSERTGEIGVRMAVGARRSDIQAQFLIEAVLVCLIGGAMGIVLALGLGAAFGHFTKQFEMVYSTASIVAAFACATGIGLAFGYLPARNAARLNPVQALASE